MKKKNPPSNLPPKKDRTHIPALHPDTLTLLLQGLGKLNISKGAKAQLRDMLKAAANPDNERVDVVIKTMSKDEQRNIRTTATNVSAMFTTAVAKGGEALRAMSDDEWQRLVDESESDG